MKYAYSWHELIGAWQQFLKDYTWQQLIQNVNPIASPCGLVYELANPLNREHESLAIVDMRTIAYAQPHYHPQGVAEFYFMLQGGALVVIGGKEYRACAGDILIIPEEHAHFTIPDAACVMAVVNTPAYKEEYYKPVEQTNEHVGFDYAQFIQLTSCSRNSYENTTTTL